MNATTRVYIAAGCALLATVFSIVGVATPAWITQSVASLTVQAGLFQQIAKSIEVDVVASYDLIACEAAVTGVDLISGDPVDRVVDLEPPFVGADFCQKYLVVAVFAIIGVILSFAAFVASLVTARVGNRPAKTVGSVALVTASVCFVVATAVFGYDVQRALDSGLGAEGLALKYDYSFALVLVALFLDVIGAVFLLTYSSNKA